MRPAQVRATRTVLAAACFVLGACGGTDVPDEPGPELASYSFFVAGHTYGTPRVGEPGLHPPFALRLEWLGRLPGMAFGVLLGDIVARPTRERWDAVDRDLARFPHPVHFAVGNHDLRPDEFADQYPDMIGRSEFVARYGPTWYRFLHGSDLFVVLDANLGAGWSIEGEQLEFLRDTLAEHADARQVFVFCHQVIWWRPEDAGELATNSAFGRDGERNYWSVLEPLFQQQQKPVYLFAGDVGANEEASPWAWSRDGEVQRIATGMGAGEEDNCVVVEVPAEGRPRLRWIALNGDDPDALEVPEPAPSPSR